MAVSIALLQVRDKVGSQKRQARRLLARLTANQLNPVQRVAKGLVRLPKSTEAGGNEPLCHSEIAARGENLGVTEQIAGTAVW